MLCLPAVTAPSRGFSGRVSPEKVNAGGGDAAASAALPVRKRRADFGGGGDGMQLVGKRPVNGLDLCYYLSVGPTLLRGPHLSYIYFLWGLHPCTCWIVQILVDLLTPSNIRLLLDVSTGCCMLRNLIMFVEVANAMYELVSDTYD